MFLLYFQLNLNSAFFLIISTECFFYLLFCLKLNASIFLFIFQQIGIGKAVLESTENLL